MYQLVGCCVPGIFLSTKGFVISSCYFDFTCGPIRTKQKIDTIIGKHLAKQEGATETMFVFNYFSICNYALSLSSAWFQTITNKWTLRSTPFLFKQTIPMSKVGFMSSTQGIKMDQTLFSWAIILVTYYQPSQRTSSMPWNQITFLYSRALHIYLIEGTLKAKYFRHQKFLMRSRMYILQQKI